MKKAKKRTVYPNKQQVTAVNNLISGKYKYKYQALGAAGYSRKYSLGTFMGRAGVKLYLQKLGKSYEERYGIPLPEKVMETYADGLNATKPHGRGGVEFPDYVVRKSYADAFAEFFGWKEQSLSVGTKMQQNNFFSVSERDKDKFNSNFKDFLRKFYG